MRRECPATQYSIILSALLDGVGAVAAGPAGQKLRQQEQQQGTGAEAAEKPALLSEGLKEALSKDKVTYLPNIATSSSRPHPSLPCDLNPCPISATSTH